MICKIAPALYLHDKAYHPQGNGLYKSAYFQMQADQSVWDTNAFRQSPKRCYHNDPNLISLSSVSRDIGMLVIINGLLCYTGLII